MGLPDGEEIMTLAFFALAQYRFVTDGQTDRRTDRHVTIAITRANVARVKTVESLVDKICYWSEKLGRRRHNTH